MKINIVNSLKNKMYPTIKDINVGDVFRYEDVIAMRIEQQNTANLKSPNMGDGEYALVLNSPSRDPYKLWYILNSTPITKLDSTLEIVV